MIPNSSIAVGYCRASRDGLGLTNQRRTVLKYAEEKRIKVNTLFCIQMPRRGDSPELKRKQLCDQASKSGLVLVPNLSRLGLDIADVVKTISLIHETGAEIVIIDERIRLRSKNNSEISVPLLLEAITLLEQERIKMLNVRAKIIRADANPRGRPRGKLGVSRLDGREAEIKLLFEKGLTRARIADALGVSRTAFYHFLDSRNIQLKSEL
ncbi:hypothetical protein PsAD13_01952 [Pseudovibrio sp. Ad13]|uniref:recombinase family protein n=1 Tax=Pseudovibrio sp. Ad13 TaxID=989396 RepID=UPI0007B27D79|nr:recombinase family protein [Pseudovibrio sp. Ad13]KZK84488.1 hypothetical protein PsAD13_01952 [Pseudovibrio sp. Ad13]